MPISIETSQKYIILTRWVNKISKEDILDYAASIKKLANEKDYDNYVVILDLTRLRSMPFDLSFYRTIFEDLTGVVTYIEVNTPRFARAITRVLSRVFMIDFLKASNIKEAEMIALYIAEQKIVTIPQVDK